MKFAGLLWLLGAMVYLVEAQDCVYKERCTCYENSTYCPGLGLKDIPPLVGAGIVQTLNFDWNSISHVPAKSLPPNLQLLSMMYNPLASIDDSAFEDSANTLQSLSLASANFTRIPNALGRLRALEELKLYSTKIKDWNDEAMNSLAPTLTSLTIQDCGLSYWPLWFKSFQKLALVSFSNNEIATIPDDVFDVSMNTITSLDIQNNSLSVVPKSISKLKTLQTLSLSMNYITNITWLPVSSKLTALFIDNNRLYDTNQLSQALFPFLTTLNELTINNNRFTSLPNLDFLVHISGLDLSHNQISDPYSGSLPPNIFSVGFDFNNLRSIPKVLMTLNSSTGVILYDNWLTQIQADDIPPWTVSADFGYNLITELTDSSLPIDSKLQYLYLNGNPLTSISSQAFRNVPQLIYLTLQQTRLSRLPLGLASGKGLSSIDFTGCADLVCTCQEKDLAPWVASLGTYNLVGTCGRTSIHEFYASLVLLCP